MNTTARRFCRPAAFFGMAILAASASAVESPYTNRIWVDAAGQFSVRASLVHWDDTSIRLLRTDGGEVTLPISMLSEQDKAYLADKKTNVQRENFLRGKPPEPADVSPQAVLQLPRASMTAASGAMLGNQGDRIELTTDSLPETLPADRSPWTVTMEPMRVLLPKIDFNMDVSAPVAISVDGSPPVGSPPDGSPPDGSAASQSMALIASISGNIRLPGEGTRQELVRFNPIDQTATVAMKHYEKIQLLDHHLGSHQSLALIGQNSLGRGGDLVVVNGWADGVMGFANRRKLFGKTGPGELPELHWAKWVDDQHFAAMVDRTVGVWNLVSGEQLFRIEGLDPRCQPHLSGGGRYLAIPRVGSVDLIMTATGQSLGRIKVEGEVPGVQFSPLGDQLAITTMRRLRVWNLTAAALQADVRSRNSLGKGHPLWIDHDLILTESGTLVSLFRGVPIWRYEIAGTERSSIGGRIAVLRKEPLSELSLLELPHAGAAEMLRRIDASPIGIDPDRWDIPGRSGWQDGQWVDRDVKIGSVTSNRR